jgi:Ni/Co efflux regulator RcnB
MQMKLILIISAAAAIMLTPATFAQNSPSNSQSTNSQTSPQQSANSNQNLTAARQIQQDLTKAGFTDVKVVAESFVVQAKSKDGDPVVMTIGPHGMSVFEAMNRSSGSDTSGQSKTTGSAPSSGSSSK